MRMSVLKSGSTTKGKRMRTLMEISTRRKVESREHLDPGSLNNIPKVTQLVTELELEARFDVSVWSCHPFTIPRIKPAGE